MARFDFASSKVLKGERLESRGSEFQQALQFNFELSSTSLNGDYLPLLIEQNHCGDCIDAEASRQIVLPKLTVEILWPGHMVSPSVVQHLLFRRSEFSRG